MTAADLLALRELLRRLSASFLLYVRQAEPFATPAEAPLLAGLNRAAADVQAVLDRIVVLLAAERQPPPSLGLFPTGFAAFNYVTVRHLLPALRKELAAECAAIGIVLATLGPAAGGLAQQLLNSLKRAQTETTA